LIDDLDRCLPSTTLSILEGIKNFLSVSQCVFVLGLNPAIVYAGIQHRFLGVSVSGREYLEKILNYSFYVPEPDAADIEKFATHRLTDLISDSAIKNDLNTELATFGQVLSTCRYTNPRKIKRVLNRYLLFLSRYNSKLSEYDINNIVKLIVQAEYYPDLFQIFLSNNDQVEQLKKIGTKDFKLADFQTATGVLVAEDYGHLSRIRELFNISDPLPPKANLEEHARDVFAIARLK
jgi:predicted KAP-like P-loop ATPase